MSTAPFFTHLQSQTLAATPFPHQPPATAFFNREPPRNLLLQTAIVFLPQTLPTSSFLTPIKPPLFIPRIKTRSSTKKVGGGACFILSRWWSFIHFAAARAPSFALQWVERNVAAYHPHTQIEAIAVGNEVFVDPRNTTKFLVPAMKNIHQALIKHNLHNDIKVSSPIALSALGNSYPSSSGSFRPELVQSVFKPMLEFLCETGSYLMVNVYPFFAYESNVYPSKSFNNFRVAMFIFESGLWSVESGSVEGCALDLVSSGVSLS